MCSACHSCLVSIKSKLVSRFRRWGHTNCQRTGSDSVYLAGLWLLATNCERRLRGSLQCTFAGFSISSLESQGIALVSLAFWTCRNKFALQIFSRNSHRAVAGVLNPSQFRFCAPESARNVRKLCPGLATYETIGPILLLIGDKWVSVSHMLGANCHRGGGGHCEHIPR